MSTTVLIWKNVHSLASYQRPEIVAVRADLANTGASGFASEFIEDVGLTAAAPQSIAVPPPATATRLGAVLGRGCSRMAATARARCTTHHRAARAHAAARTAVSRRPPSAEPSARSPAPSGAQGWSTS